MARAITGLLAQLLISTMVFSLNMFFLALAGLLQLLPTAIPLVGRVLWALLVLSCRLYVLVLVRLAPLVRARTGVDLTDGLWRVGATLTLSLLVGTFFLFLLAWPVNGVLATLFILHGLFVGLAWEEIQDHGGLQLGVKLQ